MSILNLISEENVDKKIKVVCDEIKKARQINISTR